MNKKLIGIVVIAILVVLYSFFRTPKKGQQSSEKSRKLPPLSQGEILNLDQTQREQKKLSILAGRAYMSRITLPKKNGKVVFQLKLKHQKVCRIGTTDFIRKFQENPRAKKTIVALEDIRSGRILAQKEISRDDIIEQKTIVFNLPSLKDYQLMSLASCGLTASDQSCSTLKVQDFNETFVSMVQKKKKTGTLFYYNPMIIKGNELYISGPNLSTSFDPVNFYKFARYLKLGIKKSDVKTLYSKLKSLPDSSLSYQDGSFDLDLEESNRNVCAGKEG